MAETRIIARVLDSPLAFDAAAWNALLAHQSRPTPFMRHEYLAALHASGSATPETGWTPRFMGLWAGAELLAACPLYLKSHSYGEYVFDWAWANAYAQHGLAYYPKTVVAVPFTPVPGTRLLARDQALRVQLLGAVRDWCESEGLSPCTCCSPPTKTCKRRRSWACCSARRCSSIGATRAPRARPTAISTTFCST
jgi:Uncharacterized protein conserved in bacteria